MQNSGVIVIAESKDKYLITDSLCYCSVVEDIWVGYNKKPFITTSQAKQVFYAIDHANKRWSMVLQHRTMHGTDDNDELILDISGTPFLSSNISILNVEKEANDVHAICDDHHEGLLSCGGYEKYQEMMKDAFASNPSGNSNMSIGHKDILAVDITHLQHPRCVLDVGKWVGIQQFFEASSTIDADYELFIGDPRVLGDFR
ncbi:hypothetical protein V8G54_002302 [Vigna mungo]|uniref:DUF4216 domain-containing protein n=1 Tax=Vigna mungo TaxID=3915 RepID=A0AAQ3P908_VIGMU